MSLDLEAIKARAARAAGPTDAFTLKLLAQQDVPALVAEVERLEAEVHRLTNSESGELVLAVGKLNAATRRADGLEADLRLANRNTTTAGQERDEARRDRDRYAQLLGEALRIIHLGHRPIPVAQCQSGLCQRLREAVGTDA